MTGQMLSTKHTTPHHGRVQRLPPSDGCDSRHSADWLNFHHGLGTTRTVGLRVLFARPLWLGWWIHDLSAPDPLGLMTLFGLIPWNVPPLLSIIDIGILPIIMGFTMWLQQKLNPAPADPTQAVSYTHLTLPTNREV